MVANDLTTLIATYYETSHRLAQRSFFHYLDRIVIDSRPDPKRFGLVAEPWQMELYQAIGPALESVSGLREGYTGPRSFWIEMGRGHDKTSGIGRSLNWLAGYSPRRLSMVTAAADTDQAGLIREAMQAEARLNPWLEKRVKHYRGNVAGYGGFLKILSADVGSSWGLNPDVVVVDEITHWKKRDLWDVLWSSREKRPGSVFIVITNAGLKNSWQEDLLELAREDPTWFVWQAPQGKQLASWMSPEAVERMRKMLPRGLARRVLDNVWIDPAEESDYLTRAEVEECEALGVVMGLLYTSRGRRGMRYVASIDYGPKRDRTALCVMHKEPSGIIVVDKLDVWQGRPDDPIQISEVERWLDEVNTAYQNPDLVVDPYQLEGTAQEYERHQKVERFEARGGKKTYQMAENLRSLVISKRIAWYPGAGLLVTKKGQETLTDELVGLVLKPTPYGYRFDHEVGFHDDRSVAVGMGALYLEQMDPSGPGVPAVPLTKRPATEKTTLLLRGKGSHAERRGIFGLGR